QVRSLLAPDMPAALQAGCSAARDQDRKVLVIVKAGIPHATAVQVDRVIEERAVTIGSSLHSLEELGKQRNMVRIDLRYLRQLFRIPPVMAGRMVRIGDADVRVRTIALLARELEGDDARNVCLEGQNLQVEHELGVVGERRRDSDRPVEVGRLVLVYRLLGA